jgi:hypothetical protein
MSCWCKNRDWSTIERIRELAKKSAKMDECVYVLYKKRDGSYGFCKEIDNYLGEFVEYIYY